jgi:dihydrofolate reductase
MNIILACDKNYGIGVNNSLPPWNLKKDMMKFRKLTEGKYHNAVIMGKNTYLSFDSPLPNRINIVVSHSLFEKYMTTSTGVVYYNGFIIFKTLSSAFIYANNAVSLFDDGEVWIIGGSTLYESAIECIPIIKAYVTLVDKCFLCDTFLKEKTIKFIETCSWKSEEIYKNDDISYRFLEFDAY